MKRVDVGYNQIKKIIYIFIFLLIHNLLMGGLNYSDHFDNEVFKKNFGSNANLFVNLTNGKTEENSCQTLKVENP